MAGEWGTVWGEDNRGEGPVKGSRVAGPGELR